MIVGDIIERNARLYGAEPAVVFGDVRITHQVFAERVRRLINVLVASGVGRQDRIAILSRNRSEYLEIYGAAELGGMIATPINYRLTYPEVAHIVQDAQPAVVFFEGKYADTVARLRESAPGIRLFVCLDGRPSWSQSYDDMIATGSSAQPAMRAAEDDVVYLIYTSGTTGRPKGVMLHQAGQIETARAVAAEAELTARDRFLLVMPLFHIGGKCIQLGHAWAGGTVVVHEAFDPAQVHAAVERERVSTTLLAPTMVRMLLDDPSLGKHDRSSLCTIVYSASPMPVALLRRAMAAYGPIFMQFYGLTESGPMGTTLRKQDHVLDGSPDAARRLGSAGRASAGCQIRVVDPDGRDCAAEERGEILIHAPSVMRGYWRNAGATADALPQDGWLRTGDVGVLDREKYLYLVDRKKDMIVSGGENIYPREVEEALAQHLAVAEAAVIGAPDDKWGEAVVAYAVLRPGACMTAQELIDHCRTCIASYKKPKHVIFVDALPKFPNGKVDKKMLRALHAAGAAAHGAA